MDRQEFLDNMADQIRCKRAVPYLKKELEDHIEDQKEDFISQGMSEETAEITAVEEMGDPVEIGVLFDRIHRPKMAWSVLAGAVVMSVIGISIQIILASFYYDMSGGVVEGSIRNGDWTYYWDVLNVQNLVSGQLLTVFAGIVIMLFVCYLDYSVLVKSGLNMWRALNLVLLLSYVSDIRILTYYVNGVNRRAVFLVYFSIPLYAAVLYHYRGQGNKGLIKSVAYLALFLMILFLQLPLGFIFVIASVDVLMLCISIFKGWYGNRRRKLYGIMAGCLLGGAVTVVCMCMIVQGRFTILPQYYMERLNVIVNGNVEDGIASSIIQFIGGGNGMANIESLIEYIKSDYIWLFIFEHLGTAVGCILLAIFVGFVFLLIRMTVRQKNQLGYIVSIGCILFFIIEAIFYIGGNFGYSPFMGSYMPFFTSGLSVNIVTYFYLGLLLSVHRNSNVVRN